MVGEVSGRDLPGDHSSQFGEGNGAQCTMTFVGRSNKPGSKIAVKHMEGSLAGCPEVRSLTW